MNQWGVIERPGYLGKRRDEKFAEWNNLYGPGKWRLVWRFQAQILGFLGACQLYEDSYCVFFRDNPEIMDELVTDACEIYDDAKSNVASGLDYTKQETDRTHIQDIAIRNCVVRLGKSFRGSELVQIRGDLGTHRLSKVLSPGNVPFHLPLAIERPELAPKWAKSGSVESFYQSNRYLEVSR